MAAKKTKNQVPAARKDRLPDDPALYDYGEDAGVGIDELGREDLLIPMLSVLQTNSPEVSEIDGAKAGMLFNTATQKLYEDAVFVPCHRQHVFTEWVPRETGGGFVGMHEPASDVVVRAKEGSSDWGKYKTREGNDLVETFYVYGLLIDETDGPQHVVVPFSSTKIKKYKSWMTVASSIRVTTPDGRRVTPPMFAHRYRLATVKEKNQKGEYRNFVVALDGPDAASCRLSPADPLYQEARAFREIAVAGRARVDAGESTQEEPLDDDVPF